MGIKEKYQEWRKAIKNPPADRLARIEYRSHFLQMAGVTLASIILVYKGLWYIVFAFIFMLGINYSQGMNAYRKYKNIKEFMPKEKPGDYEKDISFTRKRSKIIKHVYGNSAKWFSIVISVFTTYVMLGTGYSWWLMSLMYLVMMGLLFFLIYFIVLYTAAYQQYKEEVRV